MVISGGPGFGKTSIISELESQGHSCAHEVSRSIIRDQLSKGGDILPWKNLETFSRLIFEKRLQQYHDYYPVKPVFFDRGLPDIIAYMSKDLLEVPDKYMQHLETCSYYPKVFITPPWEEIYRKDSERMEDFRTATEIHGFITDIYGQLGYEILILPKVGVKERVAFILNELSK